MMKRKIRYMAYSAIYCPYPRQCAVPVEISGDQGHYKAGLLAVTLQMVPYMQISLFAASGYTTRACKAWGIKEAEG